MKEIFTYIKQAKVIILSNITIFLITFLLTTFYPLIGIIVFTIVASKFSSIIQNQEHFDYVESIKKYLFKIIAVIVISYSLPFTLALLYAVCFFGIGTYVQASYIVAEIFKIYALAFIFFNLNIKESFAFSFKTISGNLKYNLPIIFVIACPSILQIIIIKFVPEFPLLSIICILLKLTSNLIQLLSFILVSLILNEKIFKTNTPELSLV